MRIETYAPDAEERPTEGGYILIAVIVITAFCLVLTAAMLEYSRYSASLRTVTSANTKNYYEVEKTINMVTAWLQSNSKNIVNAFSSANFNTNFDLTSPTVGDNEGSSFQVPTLVKMKGTSHAVQLTNNAFFGTSYFPPTTNIDTAASYNAVTSFTGTNFGNVAIRILLVWARSTDGHYEPIFRIDAITGSDPQRGVHGVNFVRSDLVVSSVGLGYYSDDGDFQTSGPNNTCNSYQWTWNSGTSTWSRGASRTNCILIGKDDMTFKGKVWGSVYTKKSGGLDAPSIANISGTKCQGTGCHSYTLPAQSNWATWCSGGNQGNVSAAAPTNLVAGATRATQCWDTITVGSNKTLNFSTANQPYFIKTLTLQNNSNSKVTFTTVGPGNKYTLYFNSFAGGSINGNQFFATNLAPNQIEVNIMQDGTLTMNGTATVHGVFNHTANSTVNLLGNFSMFGAIRANAISVGGNAIFNYDEGIGTGGALSDIQFSLYKASQRYR